MSDDRKMDDEARMIDEVVAAIERSAPRKRFHVKGSVSRPNAGSIRRLLDYLADRYGVSRE